MFTLLCLNVCFLLYLCPCLVKAHCTQKSEILMYSVRKQENKPVPGDEVRLLWNILRGGQCPEHQAP